MLTHGLRGTWLALARTERAGLWPLWGGGAKMGRVFWLSEKDGSLDTYSFVIRRRKPPCLFLAAQPTERRLLTLQGV